jgi:hypothetical protein
MALYKGYWTFSILLITFYTFNTVIDGAFPRSLLTDHSFSGEYKTFSPGQWIVERGSTDKVQGYATKPRR